VYDFDGDEELKERFFESINNGDVQMIGGRIRRTDGEMILLNQSNMLDKIQCDSQCTENEDVFNFGEMYVGSTEIKVNLPKENINLIKGGELRLFFRTENIVNKWIPLGVWDIVSAEREAGNYMTIKGYDRLNRLNAPIDDDIVGAIRIESALRKVSKVANVEFAQTIEELQETFGEAVHWWATTFLKTCWDEVRAIAKFLGAFVLANREGKIEFRKFQKNPVLVIPSDKRFSVKIDDYLYSVKGVSYTDEYGNTVSCVGKAENAVVLGFSDCKYVWETDDKDSVERQYCEKNCNRARKSWNVAVRNCRILRKSCA